MFQYEIEPQWLHASGLSPDDFTANETGKAVDYKRLTDDQILWLEGACQSPDDLE